MYQLPSTPRARPPLPPPAGGPAPFTWRRLKREPTRVAARLAAALALNASTPVAP